MEPISEHADYVGWDTIFDQLMKEPSYRTLEETIRSNGDRHKANCERYLTLGMYNHACGSLRKALRNYRRAKRLSSGPGWIGH